MLKASHVNIGSSVALGSIILSGGVFSPFVLFYPLLSLLPDADHHSSTVTKSLKVQLPAATHRGYSHSILFAISVALIIFFGFKHFYPSISEFDLFVLMAVTFSHLLGDFFTHRGVPLFYPFTSRSFGIPLFTTGSRTEKVITMGLAMANIGMFIHVALKYVIPKAYTLASYENTFLIIALVTQGFVTYLLMKDEIVFFKKNMQTVVQNMLQTILFLAINFGVLIVAYKMLVSTGGLIDPAAIAASMGVSSNIVLGGLFILGMSPSMIKALRHIDNMSFPFASSVNVAISFGLLIFFAWGQFLAS